MCSHSLAYFSTNTKSGRTCKTSRSASQASTPHGTCHQQGLNCAGSEIRHVTFEIRNVLSGIRHVLTWSRRVNSEIWHSSLGG
jgi:hypothetical protein